MKKKKAIFFDTCGVSCLCCVVFVVRKFCILFCKF
jgi:hypothetical protein